MRKNLPLILTLLFITVLFNLNSCLTDPVILENYIIKVDSIRVPDTIIAETPFDIEFFGTVGLDECHSFKTFDIVGDTNKITIAVLGTFNNENSSCPDTLVLLNGQKLNITIHNRGTYTINITQPTDYILVKQIVVE